MEGKQIGIVINYLEKPRLAVVKLIEDIQLGNTLRFVDEETDFTQIIDSLQIDGENVETAVNGDEVSIKVFEKVRYGNRVYLVD